MSVLLRDAPGGAVVAAYGAGARVEVVASARTWYLVRIGNTVGSARNTALVLRDPVL